ncbi:MAG: universal stress protein [Coriobacteriaceae bacterium]|jgi:nucleotide-binding universal stress UspA family protein|nr:universal stress protein [Coriobacteriaceae bacterium]
MALEKIFVAYDGSEHSQRALSMAKDIAILSPHIKVDVVNVVLIPLLTGVETSNLTEIIGLMVEYGESILADAKKRMTEIEDQVTTHILRGSAPAIEILKMLDENDYDLAIMGNRGLSGLREFMGSVSYKVLHQAKVPVLVVD